jgi:hypothetical protein
MNKKFESHCFRGKDSSSIGSDKRIQFEETIVSSGTFST